jgi:hypothetical protein
MTKEQFNQRIAALDWGWDAEPIEKAIAINMVQAYRCPGCKRVFINKLSALRHADKCVKNPHNKTCLTCMNRIALKYDVAQEDRYHCVLSEGEVLIDKRKFYLSGHGEDAEYQYTGHDIVWDCPHHRHGKGWMMSVDNYDDALDYIEKRKKS